jgi:hypothetical protein
MFKAGIPEREVFGFPARCAPGNDWITPIPTKAGIHETTIICPKYNTVIPACLKPESRREKFLDSRLAALPGMTELRFDLIGDFKLLKDFWLLY